MLVSFSATGEEGEAIEATGAALDSFGDAEGAGTERGVEGATALLVSDSRVTLLFLATGDSPAGRVAKRLLRE